MLRMVITFRPTSAPSVSTSGPPESPGASGQLDCTTMPSMSSCIRSRIVWHIDAARSSSLPQTAASRA